MPPQGPLPATRAGLRHLSVASRPFPALARILRDKNEARGVLGLGHRTRSSTHSLPGSPPGRPVTLSALGLAPPAVAIPRPPSPSLRPVPATRVRPSPWQRRCQATRSRDSGPSPGRGRGVERLGGGAKRGGGVAWGKGGRGSALLRGGC